MLEGAAAAMDVATRDLNKARRAERAHCNLQGDSINKIHQKRHYCGTFSYHFADISGRKLKFFFAEFLRYGNPDMHFLGTLKNKLQISQKCEYSHYEFEVRCDFRGDI